MKRHLIALLIAYAASMTLVAAWCGAWLLILGRIMATSNGPTPGSPVDWAQVLANFGSPVYQTGPLDLAVMLVAGTEPSTLAAAAALISACCLAFAARRRRNPTRPDPEKD